MVYKYSTDRETTRKTRNTKEHLYTTPTLERGLGGAQRLDILGLRCRPRAALTTCGKAYKPWLTWNAKNICWGGMASRLDLDLAGQHELRLFRTDPTRPDVFNRVLIEIPLCPHSLIEILELEQRLCALTMHDSGASPDLLATRHELLGQLGSWIPHS